jgi:hypothetical protein
LSLPLFLSSIHSQEKSHWKIKEIAGKNQNHKSPLSSDSNNNSRQQQCEITTKESSTSNVFNSFDQNNNDRKSLMECSINKAKDFHKFQKQQLLQNQIFNNPQQLEQLIMSSTRDTVFLFEQKRKQLELLIHQIRDQLHTNILQQTHLIQNKSSSSDSSRKMNSLLMQQQELAQQYQLVQKQYLLHQGGLQLLFPNQNPQDSTSPNSKFTLSILSSIFKFN